MNSFSLSTFLNFFFVFFLLSCFPLYSSCPPSSAGTRSLVLWLLLMRLFSWASPSPCTLSVHSLAMNSLIQIVQAIQGIGCHSFWRRHAGCPWVQETHQPEAKPFCSKSDSIAAPPVDRSETPKSSCESSHLATPAPCVLCCSSLPDSLTKPVIRSWCEQEPFQV